jgi:hypothetical protein
MLSPQFLYFVLRCIVLHFENRPDACTNAIRILCGGWYTVLETKLQPARAEALAGESGEIAIQIWQRGVIATSDVIVEFLWREVCKNSGFDMRPKNGAIKFSRLASWIRRPGCTASRSLLLNC